MEGLEPCPAGWEPRGTQPGAQGLRRAVLPPPLVLPPSSLSLPRLASPPSFLPVGAPAPIHASIFAVCVLLCTPRPAHLEHPECSVSAPSCQARWRGCRRLTARGVPGMVALNSPFLGQMVPVTAQTHQTGAAAVTPWPRAGSLTCLGWGEDSTTYSVPSGGRHPFLLWCYDQAPSFGPLGWGGVLPSSYFPGLGLG